MHYGSCLAAGVLALSASTTAAASSRTGSTAAAEVRVLAVVDALKARLLLPQKVSIAIVADNPLMVSVDPVDARRESFRMSFEEAFLAELSDAELEAVVAHELGHVWIYTHHPYLHTEALANEIAMRVVARPVLDRVYEKVRARGGRLGDVRRFDDR
jgi:hypothetical protein